VSASKKGLGRGFESLIPIELLDESFDPTASQDEQISELRQIKISEIIADPEQPRHYFDEASLEDLAESVREHGILQPIVVTPKSGGYQIVAGERRYRASKMANLTKIPALVRTLSGQHKLELSLIENIQRQDLNIIETATAYLKLRDQFNLTLEQIGKRVGKRSVSAVSNTIRLLKLPKVAIIALSEGKVTEGQVRPLIGLDTKLIEKIVPKIIGEGWTSRQTENYISQLKTDANAVAPKNDTNNNQPTYVKQVEQLSKRFNTDIRIKSSNRGSGQIIIRFKDEKEFERIKTILDK